MKRAMFTLFQHQRWQPMRRLTLLFIFTWGFLGLTCAHAQITAVYSADGNTSSTETLASCTGNPSTGTTIFTDDNTSDGNYADNRMRRDTVEICPSDLHSYTQVSITEFDIETGDTLFVYDGNKMAFNMGNAPVIGTGTGVGVSRGFGGWINANCDPRINASGCLTFIFKTDGDNSKGKGWEAWVDCAARAISFENLTIQSRVLTADSAAFGHITLPAPKVNACGTILATESDSVRLSVLTQLGTTCIDTILSYSGVRNAITERFAIGTYSAVYTLLSDDKKQVTVPFTVQAPTLVCNDNVIIPFGSACFLQISPDDILESPVDTITDTMYYNITITIGSGKNQVVKTTQNHDNPNAVIYPNITVDDLQAAGMDICNAQATVRIERIYYQISGTETICHSGIQSAACQTNVSFLDQSQPFITLDSNIDTLVACDTTGLYELLNPSAVDNCDTNIPVTISVVMDETDACYSNNGSPNITQAIVTFTAVDACGNVGSTTRTVTIIRPNVQEHIVRTMDQTLDCTETMDRGGMPGLQIGVIRNGEFIVQDTIALSTEEYICGYILTSNDLEIPTTDCGDKIYRYWSIVDWCTPGVGPVSIDTQLIVFTDMQAPVFREEDGEMQMLTVGAFDCTYNITNLFPPRATDNCSRPTVRMDEVFRIENGQLWPVPADSYTNLEIDSFYIRWIAEDECNVQLINDTLMQLIIIKDETRPTAVCTDQLNISVGSNVSIIDTADVDAGSYDACGIAKREISRDGVNFGPTVAFSCEDIKDTIQVFFRVTDIHGNTNSCWLNVLPEDKIRPVCAAFPVGTSFANGENTGNTSTVRINCDDPKVSAILNRNNPTLAELAAIGGPLPTPQDNCPDARNVELTPVVLQIGTCGQDVYQRRWVAQDIWGLESIDTCTQTIAIDYVEDWEITFPQDANLVCPMSPETMDSVTFRSGHCDKLAINVESQMFDVVADACFKVINTYHIINWCNYNPGDAPSHTFNADNMPENGMLTEADIPNLSYITFTQVIKVDDSEGPIVIIPALEEGSCIIGAHDGLLESVGSPISCGELKTFTAFASDCVTEVGGTLGYTHRLYRGTESEVLAGQALLVQQTTVNEPGNTAEVSAFVMPGTYTIEFTFTDNCGNSTLARNEYTFRECTAPTPYLLNGIAIELSQPIGRADIWANDFDQGSFDNCSQQEDLRFRIWHISLGFNPPATVQGVLDSLPTSIVFDCDFLGTQVVQIYVIDESDNFDFASTFVMIQDNMRACDGSGEDVENMIAGDITSINEEHIEDVMVKVNDVQEMLTESDGHYQFMLPTNGNYTITPEKNDAPLNGVSTFDLVLISKHILGLDTFESPYNYIAADVNKSGTITAFDLVQLRQLILNIHTELPNNQSWRFVDKTYQFITSTPLSEAFRESVTVENLTDNRMQTDFVGIKIGDVNGNATTNSLLVAEAREVSNTFNFQIVDQLIRVGEIIEIPVRAADIEVLEGYQFTLDFAGLELLEVEEGLVKATNFNTNLSDKDKLTTSWNGEANADALLFTLKMKSRVNGYLHNVLQITSDYILAEGYHTSGELLQIDLDFQPVEESLVFGLDQNAPNPFNEETVIGFTLPEANIATLKVMDIQGRVLKTIRGNFDKGYNQISLDAKTLGATGVLHYQLEAGNYLANKKMIIIE